ncbi:MAG: short-chain dehydrogenase [Phycisphaerales bacterium]|nr:short-chain dehydrogenase [Phycisphaerales bacterium]
MPVTLKPLAEQVIVITGASSGIGLVTARMAAQRGVRGLVLAARSDDALSQLEQEINAQGTTQAVAVVADVADPEAVRRIAQAATELFGGFDTWVNNAGVSIYGRVTEVSDEDHRRLFETNFWGVVNGSRVALANLRERGGALINIGSTLSDRAIPLQGMYVASKHAVKGLTDALRMEVEEAKLPVSVTLIKPAAIDTPYPAHAKNYMQDFPANPPPVYAPELVAETILYAAEHPVRDLFVGGAGKAFQVMEHVVPRATDKFMERGLFGQMHTGRPKRQRDGLHAKNDDFRERGDHDGMVRERSLYTAAVTHPKATAVLALVGLSAAAAGVTALLMTPSKPKSTSDKVADYLRRSPGKVSEALAYVRKHAPHQLADAAAYVQKHAPKYAAEASDYVQRYAGDASDYARRSTRQAAKAVRGWW